MCPLQRQQWVLLCNCLVGALPYSHYVIRSFPCAESGFSTPHNMIYLGNYNGDRQTKKKKRQPGFLAHAVIGMFCSVVANQRQPQYTYQVYLKRGGTGGGASKYYAAAWRASFFFMFLPLGLLSRFYPVLPSFLRAFRIFLIPAFLFLCSYAVFFSLFLRLLCLLYA